VEEKAGMEILHRSLPCRLTQDERNDRGLSLANAMKKYGEVEDEKKAITSGLGANLKEIRADLNRLSEVVSTGYEKRDVECQKQVDLTLKCVRILRTDTYEVVEECELRDEDLRLDLLPDRDE